MFFLNSEIKLKNSTTMFGSMFSLYHAVVPFLWFTVESSQWGLYSLLLSLSFGYVFSKLTIQRTRQPGEPPLVPGNMFFGSGKDFRYRMVSFVNECRKLYGNIFTVTLPMNMNLHMIQDPRLISTFSKHQAFDFKNIQKELNRNVFGFQTDRHKIMLTDLSKSVRRSVTKSDVFTYSDTLNKSFGKIFSSVSKDSSVIFGARQFVIQTMYKSIFKALYGVSKFKKSFTYKAVSELFSSIHGSLRFVWMGFPVLLFPKTVMSWRAIYKIWPSFNELKNRMDLGGYLRGAMKDCEEERWGYTNLVGHNMVILHVYYNNCKFAFWMLNYLMQYPEQVEALKNEIDVALAAEDTDTNVSVPISSIESLPLLSSYFLETARFTSGLFIIRKVVQDTEFETPSAKYKMRAGDMASIFTPAFYRDEDIFKNAKTFRADRFIEETHEFEGTQITNPVLPFGVLCPAKKLVLVQIKLFLVVLLTNFTLQRVSGEAVVDEQCFGDEILPPTRETKNLRFKLTPRRKVFCSVDLEESK